MIVELKRIFEIVDDSLDIEYSMDLSDYELFDDKPFITPVFVKGVVFNRAGIVTLDYSINFRLKLHCDRCFLQFERDFSYSFNQILVTSLNTDNDEFFVVPDMVLSLDPMVISDILLSLPSKLLCSKDCKGLCQNCGVNLNQTSCLCKRTDIDPRLAKLSEFFA